MAAVVVASCSSGGGVGGITQEIGFKSLYIKMRDECVCVYT